MSGPRKAGLLLKGQEGRGEYRLGDICFASHPGSAGPPEASKVLIQNSSEASSLYCFQQVWSLLVPIWRSVLSSVDWKSAGTDID